MDPPVYCFGVKEFVLANLANSLISNEISLSPFELTDLITGVIRPSSIATATDTSISFN